MSLQEASILAVTGFAIVATSLLLLQVGFIFARKKLYKYHYRIMGAALISQLIFLVIYISRFLTNDEAHFPGPDNIKYFFYYPFLLIHITLALVVIGWILTFIPRTIREKRFNSNGDIFLEDKEFRSIHRRKGRIAYVLWTISFAMGIIIFFMLYIVPWN